MKTLYVLMGLQGCGKSTRAKEILRSLGYGNAKIVNRDSLRAMLDDGHYSGQNEKMVTVVRDQCIRMVLKAGKHAISDDTNLNPAVREHLKQLAQDCGAGFEVIDMTDVPIEVCIERDLKRLASVGEKVIRDTWKKYLAPKPPKVEHDPNLPDCIVVDCDGTICINDGHRGWFEWSKVGDDKPNAPVIKAIKSLLLMNPTLIPIYVSGREDSCADQTTEWIYRNVGTAWHATLYMRKTGDFRDDAIVKRELYEAHIKGKYNVLAVWDDRAKVCEMWRSLGLACFQVAEGDF